MHIAVVANDRSGRDRGGRGGGRGRNETFLPRIRITSFGLPFGSGQTFPPGRGDPPVYAGDTVTYLRGRHSFKFGGEFRDFRNDNFNGDPGRLTFNTDTDFINGAVGSSARTVCNVTVKIT